MMDRDHLSTSRSGSRSPALNSSNSSGPDPRSTPAAGDDYNDVLRPLRACEYCRQHKVRCDLDQRDPSGSCGRCLKANRDCVSGSYSRKRRKTTDSRVLDLESRVERLTSRLNELEKKSGDRNEKEHEKTTDRQNRAESDTPILSTVAIQQLPDTIQPGSDVIDRGIVSVELAGRMFQHYVMELSTIIPVVVFPPGTSSSDIRRHKPTLFLAILAATSGEFDDTLEEKLHPELLRVLSDQIICRGLKSLEILQTLAITVLWHHPADNIGNGRLNQLAHMAAVMANDLSICRANACKRVHPDADAKGEQQWNDQFPPGMGWRFIIGGVKNDSSLPESRRALLSCYFMCSCIAQRLQRINSFPYTNYISECIDFFETSTEPGVFPSDKNLVQWIKVSRIAEEFYSTIAPSGADDHGDPSKYRTQIVLERFLGRMAEWRQAAGNFMTPVLDLFAQSIIKHMYDRMLNSERNMDDFRPLIFEALVARAQRETTMLPLTKFRADVIRACLVSVHSSLDFFLAFSPSFVRSLPVLFYVEMGYTIGMLLKMCFVAAFSNRVLDRKDIKFGDYINRVLSFLSIVTEKNKRHIAERLRLIMLGLKNWVDSHKQKLNELASLSPPKSPVPAFERPTPPPVPTQQAYPTSHLMPPRSGVDVGLPFAGYTDAERGEVGDGEMEGGDPMFWENFPLTEFLQLDGVPDLYTPWSS